MKKASLLPEVAEGLVAPEGQIILSACPAFYRLNRHCGGVDGENDLVIPMLSRLASQSWRASIAMETCITLSEGDDLIRYQVSASPNDQGVSFNLVKQTAGSGLGGETIREQDFARSAFDWVWQADTEFRLTRVSAPAAAVFNQPTDLLCGRPLKELLGILDKDIGANADRGDWTPQAITADDWARGVVLKTLVQPMRLFVIQARPLRNADGSQAGWQGTAVETDQLVAEPVWVEKHKGETSAVQAGKTGQAAVAYAGPSTDTEALRQKPLPVLPILPAEMLREPIEHIAVRADAMNQQSFGPLKGVYADYAGDIATAARHLGSLVGDVFDTATADVDAMDIVAEAFDLVALADEARAIVAQKAERSGTYIVWRDGMPQRLSVYADRARTRQILINLILNAVKFAGHAGPIVLTLSDTDREASEEKRVGLFVDDQGAGVAPDDRERIFRKFERLHTHEVEGTGLGLFISRALARAMGGELTVSVSPEGGARFALWLTRA